MSQVKRVIEDIVTMYDRGVSVNEIAQRLDVPRSWVYEALDFHDDEDCNPAAEPIDQ